MNWLENHDSSMIEHQARDLEVQVRVPVQVQIFFLKFDDDDNHLHDSRTKRT